jgi:hypothetical protein
MPARVRTAVAVAGCLLLAACTSPDPEPGDATPASTGPPPPLQAQPSPPGGGTVELGETGFTVLDESGAGVADLVWAATLRNTSGADLLTYVDVELTWHGPGGETETQPWHTSDQQRAYDVLPGGTAVIGGQETLGFAPESLDVSVHTSQWYPMANLAANGLPVGVEVTGSLIEEGPQLAVEAQFTSSYEPQPGDEENLRVLLVLRDAAGTLLGAVRVADSGASPPGARVERATVPDVQWPEQADVDSSEATVVKVCCAWVGVG